jgi:O-antigen/teichoic acid export membrane protein
VNKIRAGVTKVKGHKLARDSMWGMSLEAVSLLTSIVVFSLLGRSLGPIDYGAYVSVFTIVNPLVTLTGSGVALSLMEHAVRRQEPLDQVARKSLTITLALGSVLSVIGIVVAMLIVDEMPVLAIVVIVIDQFIVSPMAMIAAATLQSASLFSLATKMRLTMTVARTLVVVSLFVFGALEVQTYVLLNVTVLLLLAMASMRVVGRRLGFRFLPGPFEKSMLKTNAGYSVSISAYSFQNDGDKTVMTANNLTVDVGLYSAAYRVVMMGMTPVNAFLSASHTTILEQAENVKGHHLRLSIKYARLLTVYGLAFTVVAILVSPLLPLLTGDDFEGSVTMMRWLAPIVFFRALGATPINGLLGLGRMGYRTAINVTVALLSVALYVTMIPAWGWKGAVIATMIGEAVNVTMSWTALVLLQRKHDLMIDEAAMRPELTVETLT